MPFVRVKHWLFHHFGWFVLGVIAVLLGMSLFWVNTRPNPWRLTVSLWGGGLSLLFFLHKQKLEHLRLFSELFQEFNERYDDLHDELAGLSGQSGSGLKPNAKEVLERYFNLCAEEYLFYRKGYIDHSVWTAWKNGMEELWEEEPLIREAWEDQEPESHYGFNFDPAERI